MKYPQYTYDPVSHTGRLVEQYVFDTPITGHLCAIPGASLTQDGKLYCNSGFRWDFGSFIAIDTPGMVVASLAHDALCNMTQAGQLPWEERKAADAYFYTTLRKWRVPFFRAFYCWLAVRAWTVLLGVLRTD